MEAPEKEKLVSERSILGLGNSIVREERLFEQTRDRQTDRQTDRDIRVGVCMCACGCVGRGNIVSGYGCVGGQDENLSLIHI